MADGDLEAVELIDRLGFPEPLPRDAHEAELRRPWGRALVLEAGGSVLAYLEYWLVAGEMQILQVAVHADARRQGLGRVLLEAGLEQARSEGARLASLEVRAGNVAAVGLYRALGFDVVGRRLRYYPDGEDALLMSRSEDEP